MNRFFKNKSAISPLLTFVLCICAAKVAYTQTSLATSGAYIWNASDLPRTFNSKLQFSFVRTAQGFPSFGTVVAAGGYADAQDGGTFQLYIPYSDEFGGKVPQIRMGMYNNAGWSPWQTFFTSANANNLEADWSARHISANGNIRAKEVKVETTNWPDYVFADDYKLQPLSEVEQFVKLNKHLPDIPSAQQVEADGVALGEMNKLLLKKVEELTLHLIEKNKVIEQQQQQLNSVFQRLDKLEKHEK